MASIRRFPLKKRIRLISYTFIVFAGLSLLALLATQPSLAIRAPESASSQLQRAWSRAGEYRRYQYRTEVVQTLHPTLSLENVGRTARTDRFVIEGEMDASRGEHDHARWSWPISRRCRLNTRMGAATVESTSMIPGPKPRWPRISSRLAAIPWPS